MTPNSSTPVKLINVRGTELLTSDTRELYRQKLARITLDSMVQFVGLLDAKGTVLEINHVALDAVGITLSEVEGKPFWTTFWWQVSEEINTTLREAIQRAAQGEFVRWDAEIYGRAGGKETIIIDASLMPVKDEQGEVVFITAEGRDITEKKAHEREIARQREELARLDELKTQFFANISHEFRTPLTLMMGPLEDAMAEPEGLSAANRERLELAHRNSLRLLKLVNTLLDFSRIEAGRIQASYEPTDLALLTAELASVFRSTIERAGMRLIIDCPALPEMVYVDREMWEKIVLNLLSNAFKFTFEGEIEVGLRLAGSTVELTVRDTGTGIPASEIPSLFERFHRVKNARGRSYEGSGIGLALVQELAKLHGGSVRVESEVARGSRFVVSLPLGKRHLPAGHIHASREMASVVRAAEVYVEEAGRWSPAADEPILPELPKVAAGSNAGPAADQKELIVLADDNADMLDYVSRLLRDEYRVHAVRDGQQALEATRQLRPALVLTDVMMPGQDGFEVLQAIRNDPSLSSTPVVLLSARAGEESRVEGLQAGADDYLVKPFTARELLARVATHVKMANLRRESTEREARLRAGAELERQRLEELLKQAPAAIGLMSGPEHRWTFVNDLYIRSTGRSSSKDFLGRTMLESLPELEGQGFQELLDQVYHTGKPYFGREMKTVFNLSATGQAEEAYWDFVYQPVKDASGRVEGILAHSTEVTDRVVARKAIERAEKAQLLLAAIVSSSDDAIVSKDLNGIVTSWNKGAERLFGYKAEEMVGQPITLIIPPELHKDETMILGKIRLGENIDHFETVRLSKTGEKIEVSLTVSPVKDERGKVVGAAKIARNITENKKIERALRTTEKLATAGRLAATVAHEINNPLAAVTNLVYLAKRDMHDASKVENYLQMAGRELDRVAHIARQTLGFYRDTSAPTRFSVTQTLDDLLLLYEKRMETRPIQLVKQYDGDSEITGLAGEIRQAFSNLITNAIDAMPNGGSLLIRVSNSRGWGKWNLPGVRITMCDTGCGIEPQHKKNLFQPFFTTKADVGTGLGLWITRSIVEKHRGTIRVKSRTGPTAHGTAFSVFLPSEPEQPGETKVF